jgi:hypothetical protein
VRLEACPPGVGGDLASARLGGALIPGAAPVQGLDRSLVLRPQAEAGKLRAVERRHEVPGPRLAALERGVESRCLVPGQQQLEPVVPRVGDRVDPDHAPRVLRPPSGHAADQAVALAQPAKQQRGVLRHRRLLGPLDDRRQRAVDVGEDRRPGRVGAQRLQQGGAGVAVGRGGFAGHGI